MIALDVANREGQVTRPQARVTEAFDKIAGAAHPTAEKPEQFVSRARHVSGMQNADRDVFRLGLHQIVKAIDQLTDCGFAADGIEQGCGHVLIGLYKSRGRIPAFAVPPRVILTHL